MKGSIDEVK